MTETTTPLPGVHYGDRPWTTLEPLAKADAWTVPEGLAILRTWPRREPDGVDPSDEVVAWVRRDLDDPSGPWRQDPDAIYAQVAATGRGEVIFRSGRDALAEAGYGELVAGTPAWSLDRFVGLGCPWRSRLPAPGERVLDVGCGAGVDRQVAERAVGPRGRAVGVDLRPALLAPAAAQLPGTAFVQARADALPVPDGWATTVVANGLPPVLRLHTAPGVLAELARVLRPGGWIHLIVLVTGPDVADDEVDDLLLVNAIRYGKPLCAQYRSLLAAAGFTDVALELLPSPFVVDFRPGVVAAALFTGRRS